MTCGWFGGIFTYQFTDMRTWTFPQSFHWNPSSTGSKTGIQHKQNKQLCSLTKLKIHCSHSRRVLMNNKQGMLPNLLGFAVEYAAAKSLQSCLTLCDPLDGSPPGSPVPGILQARTLEWVAIAFSWKWGSVQFSSVTQSYPTLCDPMSRSMPVLPVHHQLPEFTWAEPKVLV